MVALFFVAASLAGLLFVQKTGIIKESGTSGMLISATRAANTVSVANNNALLNAPSGANLLTTIERGGNSFVLSAPEFLSRGEVKDPGAFMNGALNQSGTVAYVTNGGTPSGGASFLALRIEPVAFFVKIH